MTWGRTAALPDRAHRVWRSALTRNVAARVADLLAAGLGTLLVARYGGAAAVGVYALLRMLPGTLGTVIAGGLPGAATYFLAGPSRSDRRVPLTLIAVAAVGGIAGTALWIGATPLLLPIFFPGMATALAAVAGFRVLTYLGFSTGRACLQGIGELGASNWIIVGEDLFFVPFFLVCHWLHLGVPVALVASLLLGDAANGALAWVLLARRHFLHSLERPTLRLAGRIYAFGSRGQVGNIMLLLNLRLDFAILGALAGPATLGVYAIASRFSELLRLLPLSVFWVLYPQYARADKASTAAQARAMIPRFGLLTLAGAVPLALASAVLPWIFGPTFQAAILPAQILLIGLVGEGVGGVVTPYLYGEGRPGLNSLAMGAAVVVTVLLDILLIPRHGAVGAAVASSAAYLTATGVLLLMFGLLTRTSNRPASEESVPGAAADAQVAAPRR